MWCFLTFEINQRSGILQIQKQIKEDFVGRKFGKLTVASFAGFKGKYPYWHCVCECGTEKDIYEHNLTAGSVTSCGCGRVECGKKFQKQNFHIYQGIQVEKATSRNIQKNNTSGFRGVYKDKRTNKWRARIILQGKRTELGYFEHFAEAVEARLKAEKQVDTIISQYKNSHQLATNGEKV